jgi:hypothetical protein
MGWVLGILAWTWGALLWRRSRGSSVRWWAVSFLILGLVGIAGEIGEDLPVDRYADDLWSATLLLFGLLAYCAAATAITSKIRRGRRDPFYAFGAIGFGGYLVLIGVYPFFALALTACTGVMLVVLIQQSRWKEPASSARWLMAGIAFFLIGGILQLVVSGFPGSRSSLDLFYALQIPGGWFLYRAGLQLSNRKSTSRPPELGSPSNAGPDGWLAVVPAPGFLELGGEPEQRRFVAVTRGELDADR